MPASADTPRQALVLAAHGSHHAAGSGEPARRHARALLARGRFEQAVAAFWKEFPSLRDVRYLVDAEVVFVVPLFMADGYFSSRVVPRELELDGPLTVRDGQHIHYTPPVGTDPRLRDVITSLVDTALGHDGPPGSEVAVVVVGHGTVQNPRSKQTVLEHVSSLTETGRFAEVAAAYLEEPPLVGDVFDLVTAREVAVVPLFVADGFHTRQDIPRQLGLVRGESDWLVPSAVGDRRVWYTPAVGESPVMLEVILARVEQAREAVG